MQSLTRSWVFWLTAVAAVAIVVVDSIDSSPAREAELRGEAAREAALLEMLEGGTSDRLKALNQLDLNWQNHLTPALVEYVSLMRSPELQVRSLEILINRTDQDFGYDLNAWFAWAWQQNFEQPPYYAEFKSRLYRGIDRHFADYFSPERATDIRLDEVRWGGVKQDGIPPLRRPKMIPAPAADYLDDDNIVFGLAVNGDVRAYPKRILAWHEMFVDTVGGISVAGVYCTLCGSMILYETGVDGVQHELGTSGFLYRSNKLMYDEETQSLWNTLWGTPAIGPLVGEGIRLPRRSVVTTTWGAWRERHPETTVLSLNTGHRRDYGEGVAYRDYFSTDELMFNTSQTDNRLANKAEVLGLVFPADDAAPLAISAAYAKANPLIHENVGDNDVVVVTDSSGAMRVYASDDVRFSSWDGDERLTDSAGNDWTLSEDKLTDETGRHLARLPSHSAFWFGWYGAYPSTRLIH